MSTETLVIRPGSDGQSHRPSRTRRIRAILAGVAGVLTLVAGKALTPHRASLTRLAQIPLTVAGVGCVDYSAFHWASGWGWLVTGLSLVLLEHLIADDAGDGGA